MNRVEHTSRGEIIPDGSHIQTTLIGEWEQQILDSQRYIAKQEKILTVLEKREPTDPRIVINMRIISSEQDTIEWFRNMIKRMTKSHNT
jgi:hypothetical protein